MYTYTYIYKETILAKCLQSVNGTQGSNLTVARVPMATENWLLATRNRCIVALVSHLKICFKFRLKIEQVDTASRPPEKLRASPGYMSIPLGYVGRLFQSVGARAEKEITIITRTLAFEHMYPPNLSPIPHLDDFWAKMLNNMATGDHFPDMCGCHDNIWHSTSEN